MKKFLILLYILLISYIISCSKVSSKNEIKEIEYNGDNENAQYIDRNVIIKGIINNTKETNDIDIYRLVNSNEYTLSISLKQSKNNNINVSLYSLNGRNIFSMVKNSNIKIPLYNIKEDNIFLRIEDTNTTDKTYYTLKIDFIDYYIDDRKIEPNNNFNDAIDILAPNKKIRGSFVKLNTGDRIPNQITTNTTFSEIADVDIYRLKNPTDIDVDIEIKLDYQNMDRVEILLFDSRYNLISLNKSNSIPLRFSKNTSYYVSLLYNYNSLSEESYKIYYIVKE